MLIKTRYYGEIFIRKKHILTFTRPIISFDKFRKFVILKMDDMPGFFWLQSTEVENLTFAIADPRIFVEDYVLEIDYREENLKALEMKSLKNIPYFSIIRMDNSRFITVNLLGPILINTRKKLAVQAISSLDYQHAFRVDLKSD